MNPPHPRAVLVTGAAGYLGSQVIARLHEHPQQFAPLVAFDVRPTPSHQQFPDVVYLQGDIRDPALVDHLRRHHIKTVAHLASIVTPGGPRQRQFEYSVDVLGTRNLIQASLAASVDHLVVTSSGAAYGYHADNPRPLRETDPLRGNPEFAYSDHKRQVEEMLAQCRVEHPELRQLIFRPGTVLGQHTNNQITRLFDQRCILGVRSSQTPFVFIWDQDVVTCLVRGILERCEGIYNLAGDGTLTLRDIARLLHRPYVPLPAWLIRAALYLFSKARLTQYGPEQVMFLQHRPVLSNDALKQQFGFMPTLTTSEVFQYFLDHRQTSP